MTEQEPVWTPPRLREDDERMGLTRNTVEGAWLEFAGNLDPRRPLHVAVAWVTLAIFVLPVLFTVANVFR